MSNDERALEVFPLGDNEFASRIYGESPFVEAMYHINADLPVGNALARAALIEVLTDSQNRDARLSALLVGSGKTATPEMIKGFVEAVGDFEGIDLLATKEVIVKNDIVVGCAGSGKKGKKTINISTPSMLVAAAAGAKTLKSGSRAASSVTGSTDILESVGFKVPETTEESNEILRATNFGFYSIEHFIPKFDTVYGGRFFAPHSLSYALPALLIPVHTDTLLYGYAGPNVSLSARSLLALGKDSVMVCSNTSDGIHYIDEVATTGVTSVAGVVGGVMAPDRMFDASRYLNIEFQGSPSIDSRGTIAGQREVFVAILSNQVPGSMAENTVCLNAATILFLAKKCADPKEGFDMALNAIRMTKALDKLNEVIEVSKSIGT